MSFNIVDLVKDQISDQLLGQIGSALGTEGSQTTGAMAGALPGLLSGLVNSAGSASGAGALFDAVQKQDDGLLGNMGNLLGGDQASNIANQGSSMLSSILGSGALGQLAGVVANFAGISRGSSSSLMGMLAPIVIGVIKKKVFDGGMNANSMASMLSDQKDNVAAAMPQGFSDQLQSAGFFDSIAAAPQAAAAPAPAPAPAPVHDNAPASSGGGGLMKWLLPLVAVVAIGWFGLNFMNKQSATKAAEEAEAQAQAVAQEAEAAKAEASAAAAEAIKSAQESMPEGVDLTKISDGLEGVFGSTTDALTGITDLESAKNAIPSLEEATSKLGGINDLIARLPDAAKGPLSAVANNGLAAIQPLIEKVTAIPGVGALIEPVVQPMLDMLSGLTG